MPEEKRSGKMVPVRFTLSEYQELIERKKGTKARNLSEFIRDACLDKPILTKAEASTVDDKLLSLVREIRVDLLRTGSNINQSTKRINSTTDYFDLHQETRKLSESVQELEQRVTLLLQSIDPKEAYGSTH